MTSSTKSGIMDMAEGITKISHTQLQIFLSGPVYRISDLWNNYNLHYTSNEILSNFSFMISIL